MTDKADTTGTPKPPARPGAPKDKGTPKVKPKPKVRKMARPPEPVKTEPKSKPKRTPKRTKLAGWEKGTVRSACFYVQDQHHQAVNLAASALRVSKGIVVEVALVAMLKIHPDLEAVRPALAAILGPDWEEIGQGDETGGSDG